jgi:hypothetical protein
MKSVLARRAFLLVAFGCAFLANSPIVAKRLAPKPVATVKANGVEYSAPHEFMGFILATDMRTHEELWRQQIYSVHINPELESDVQDVFITSLVIDDGILFITNERNETYALDLTTRKVSRRR